MKLLRRRQKQQKIRKWYPLVFILLILLVGIFVSKMLQVNEIIVESDTTCATKQQLEQLINVRNQNLLFVKSENLQKNILDKFLCIKKIEMIKKFPNSLHVKMIERTGVIRLSEWLEEASASAMLNREATSSAIIGREFVVDDEGIIFQNYSDQSLETQFISWGFALELGGRIDQKITSDLLKIISVMKKNNLDVSQIFLSNDRYIYISQTPKILLSFGDDLLYQLGSLQLILDKAKIDGDTIEFIDLRFDKPIVKFAPKKK